MLIKSLGTLHEFVGGDHTELREFLNPDKDSVALRYSLAHAKLPPQVWSSLHVLTSSEVYYILRGAGRMEINGEQRDVVPGDMI